MSVAARQDDWSVPGVYEVASEAYRVPLPLPNTGLRTVNVYVIVGDDGLVLIDSGWATGCAGQLLADALKTLGCGFADIRRFLITHVHRDHYTQAIGVRREFGAQISLGAGERPSLELLQAPGRGVLEARLHRLLRYGATELAEQVLAQVAGQSPPDPTEWESPDDWLEEGALSLSSGRQLNVIETPGHTRGHVVFHDSAAKLLFAGDQVLPDITPSVGLEPAPSPNPLGEFLGSLARMRRMPDAVLLPAHGQVAASVHARIDELVDHHSHRLDEIAAAVAIGADTALQIAGQLHWTRRRRFLSELDIFNQVLAIFETGAHLDLLLAQQRLDRALESGVFRYRSLP